MRNFNPFGRKTYTTDFTEPDAPLVDASVEDATLIGSRLMDAPVALHLPVIDIDFEARLLPSTTEGHYHLYLDGMRPLLWEEYCDLLCTLAETGVISERYVDHCLDRGQSLVRAPWTKKLPGEGDSA